MVKANSSEGRKVRAKFCGMCFSPLVYFSFILWKVGCDSGHSSFRTYLEHTRLSEVQMKVDWFDTPWGAINTVIKSNFPDLRKICKSLSSIPSPPHLFISQWRSTLKIMA